MKSVLFGILYSGEPQLASCLNSIRNQKNICSEFFIIKHLPNKEAHDLLYNTFSSKSEFDFYIKIDADMVLTSPEIVERSLAILDSHNSTHFIFGVQDFFTGVEIYGIHFFKQGHKFILSSDPLFVDYVHNEKTASFVGKADIVAFHSFDPSHQQSYHYGLHKAFKALQPHNRELVQQSSRSHLRKIRSLTKQFLTGFRYEHFCSLLGCYRAFTGGITIDAVEYQKFYSERIYERTGFLVDVKDCLGFILFLFNLVSMNDEKLYLRILSNRR